MPLYAEITYPPDVDWTAHGAEVAGYGASGASAAAMRRHAIGGA